MEAKPQTELERLARRHAQLKRRQKELEEQMERLDLKTDEARKRTGKAHHFVRE